MTNYIEVLFIGLVLSADSFSAALAMGARPHSIKDSLKFAATSGGAEALVSFIGAAAGSTLISTFKASAHLISFMLLLIVALHIAYEGFIDFRKNTTNSAPQKQFHHFTKILIVSLATSLDAFSVGIGLGVTGRKLVPYIISIGCWAIIATMLGMKIGKMASHKVGAIFNFIAATILLLLGFNFLIGGFNI